jgi:hypothetical protein
VDVDQTAIGDLLPLRLRAASGRLQDLHDGLDHPVDTLFGGDRDAQIGEQAHVDPEGLVGPVSYLLDLVEEILLGFVVGGRQAAETSRFGHQCRDLCRGQCMHGSASNRIPDSQHLGHLRLEHFLLQ